MNPFYTTNLKLTHTQQHDAHTQHQTFFTIFTIKIKKEQAINLHQKYFNLYDTFYYNKQKEQAKKYNHSMYT